MSSDLLNEPALPRFIIGIDLGTTNSAVSYLDTEKKRKFIRTFSIPQWTAFQQVEERETLPSFHYEMLSEEQKSNGHLPFESKSPGYAVGVLAREHGGRTAGRLVSSAKSWFSHRGVDRTADILPWQAAEGVRKISPVEAASRFLRHLRLAWNHRFPEHPMETQDVVITLPASFDEVARELTVRASKQAGLPKIVLLEEPQAAFYAWVHAHARDWHRHVSPGQKILICDIGGGTTDLTLIRVRKTNRGKIHFHRVAVGEHLILGGDNLDLALAHHMERRLGDSGRISAKNWGLLVRLACRVKEKFLGANPPEKMTVHLPDSGSRLLEGSRQMELERDEVEKLLIDGFLPKVPLDSIPQKRPSGLREMGLPYAADHAVTKYLARFLTAHVHTGMTAEEMTFPQNAAPETAAGHSARPDILLVNGGMFESVQVRERLLEVLTDWFQKEPVLLENERLDLAVARGAVYYGMVRRGLGEKIHAALPRTYYLGVEAEHSPAAVCLFPAGTETDQEMTLPERTFLLKTEEPVQFPIYVSSVRLTDAAGAVIPYDPDEMSALPPIQTVVKTRRKSAERVTVTLAGRLTEMGTLELWCTETGGQGRWRLNFDVRSATQTEREAATASAGREEILDESGWQRVRETLDSVFTAAGTEKPQYLMKRLAQTLEQKPDKWPTLLLRRMGETLLEMVQEGRKSPEHETRYLNLLGYAFRPGFGCPMDDWRMEQLWRTLQGNLRHGTPACRLQWWILWRRIAGGLSQGQQRTLAAPILSNVGSLYRQLTSGKGRGSDMDLASQEGAELWRLLGSLERLTVETKSELGTMLGELVSRKRFFPIRDAMIWALGRLGARQLSYGPLDLAVPVPAAEAWIHRLLEISPLGPAGGFALMLLARKTGDRYRDIGDVLRTQVLRVLSGQPHFAELVRESGGLNTAECGLMFGEPLPSGLTLSDRQCEGVGSQ
ncbi:MAG: hsp70 family protein [Planctomycetaceae bacterium]|nr:hsp70 family protein [Planctomycetaceae bacterium]